MSTEVERVPLRRLLRPPETRAWLLAFSGLVGPQPVAVVDAGGGYLAGAQAWDEPFVAGLLADLGAAPAGHARRPEAVARSIWAGPHLAGAVVAAPAVPEAVQLSLQASLQLLVSQALEKREVARETLDRYREINLLYNVAETIGAGLDPGEIPQQALAAARRVIKADAAAVFLPVDAGMHKDAGDPAGFTMHVEAAGAARAADLQAAALPPVAWAYQRGRPDIVGLPAPAGSGPNAPLTALLCAPLKARERVHGVLVLGRGPGEPQFTASDEKLAMALASQAAVAFEKAALHQQALQRQRLEEEMAVGRQIQMSFLPEAFPRVAGWDFAASYAPARQVGGDFYDLYPLADQPHRLGLVIGDVTGKGVAAALMMAASRTTIRTASMSGRDPRAVLERANRLISADNRAQLFLSAFYATLDTLTGELRYACGGHDRPLWLRGGGTIEALDARSLILGAFDDVHLEERAIWLAPGEDVLFYTDGVSEAMNAEGEFFGEARMRAVLLANGEATAQEVVEAMLAAVRDFAGDTAPSDDLTLMVVRRCPT